MTGIEQNVGVAIDNLRRLRVRIRNLEIGAMGQMGGDIVIGQNADDGGHLGDRLIDRRRIILIG